MPKPILSVFIGDLHEGSHSGLCIPGFPMGGHNKEKKRPYASSLQQDWLKSEFDKQLKIVKERAKGHRLFLKLGGDLVDGVNHHGTTETTGNVTDETDMAAQTLEPWCNAAEDVKGVTGTESHTGSRGDWDSIVYTKLGVPYQAVWNVVEDGKRLWWAHHGVKVGGRVWNEENSAILMARDIAMQCERDNKPAPDLIMAHHAHRTFRKPPTVQGITIAVCPCWQLPTYYGDTISPFTSTKIGLAIWEPSTHKLDIIIIPQP